MSIISHQKSLSFMQQVAMAQILYNITVIVIIIKQQLQQAQCFIYRLLFIYNFMSCNVLFLLLSYTNN